MRFFNFFLNHIVQKYQNEISPIFYYGISIKTNEKDLKIPNLQLPDWKSPYWMTLYVRSNLLSSMSPRCQAATRSRRGHARCPGCRGPACSSGSASRRRARWGPIRTRHLVTWPQCSSPIGQHLGMCMDGFMFGSCCVHDTQDNLIQDSGHTTSKVSSRSDLMIPLATFFFWLHNCPEISVTTIDVKARVDIFMA